jgi:predicted MFS family arabinose efflux permease
LANLIFSIKQTGVPIGGVIAGALIPSLIDWTSWRSAGLIIGFGSIAIGLALLPSIRPMDREYRKTGASSRSFLDPLRVLMAIRPLRNLAFASMAFAAMQLCLNSFLTVHLVEGVHLRLVEAGALFATAQTASIVGRVGWGVVADRVLSPTATMVLLGLLMAAAAVAVGFFDLRWPFWLMAAICAIYGASASGWVGVVLSEVSRFSPPGQAGVMTGAAQTIMFIGVLIGPLMFSAVLSVTGAFSGAFAAIAVFTLIGVGFAMRADAAPR